MKKKIFCLAVGAALTVSSAGVTMADQDWKAYDIGGISIDYSTYTGGVRKTGNYNSNSDTAPSATEKIYSLTIPSDIDGTKITIVSDSGFYDDNALKDVKLPATLEKIGLRAFAGADNLQSITIPDSVKEIGNEAFLSCDSLKKIVIGKGLEKISQYCFKGCKSVTSITIPENVKSIDSSAFEGCKSLETVTFKGTIDSIGNGAFKNCGLKSVVLPSGITSISSNLFEECSSLEKIEIPSGVKTIEQSAFKNCKNLKAIYIPDTCKTIADSAFSGCKNVVIYGSKNSFASSFADKQGIKFETTGFNSSSAVESSDDSEIKVVVNGELLDCGTARPVIIDGRTLVPLRPIFEALGVELLWNGNTKTITGTKSTKTIKLTVGNTTASLNGKSIELDVPAQIIDGNTMVPLRFIGDCLDCDIKWSQQTKTATISQ